MRTSVPKKPRSGTPARREPHPHPEAWRKNSDLLLTIIDELDLIDGMLRCVPELSMAVRLIRDEESADEALDPIASLIKIHSGKRRRQHDRAADDVVDFRLDLLGSPDAMVDTARWRLKRVRTLLEVVRPQTPSGRGG
ncbi:MAG: hypothetical protein L0Z53_13395 [Acidobacteriales bacterium]|nr:hypothetical protein [Terriglobales bacterium]